MAKRNKMLRKILVTMCSAVLLVGATVGVTVAYLTSTDEVNNTFTVGKVEITLDEAKVDLYGKEDTEADRVKTNEYKLIPGHTYVKDPEVHVTADSEDCYLFVEVTNEISAIEAAGDTTIAAQMAENDWIQIGTTNIYYYKDVITTELTDRDIEVFESFTVDGSADVEYDAEKVDDVDYTTKKITIKAYAVQEDGFTDAESAWNATFGKN